MNELQNKIINNIINYTFKGVNDGIGINNNFCYELNNDELLEIEFKKIKNDYNIMKNITFDEFVLYTLCKNFIYN